MAAKERLSEDIKYLIELLRLIWLSLIALGSGTIGLLLGDLTTGRMLFAGAGIMLSVVLIGAITHLHRQIKRLIAQLTEMERWKLLLS